MFNRQLLVDASLAFLIAVPTLALPAPDNATTELSPEPVTIVADQHVDRLAAAARAAGPQRVRS